MSASRLRCAAAAFALSAALIGGCTATVTGSAAIESTPQVRIGRNVVDVLPTHGELSAATGVSIERDDFRPRVGGVQVLGRGGDYSGRAECIGAAKEAAARAYRELPVWAVATADWGSEGFTAPTMFIDVAAIAMRSDAAARDALTEFGRQWDQCQGAQLRLDNAAGSGLNMAYRVDEVHSAATQLSAEVVFITGTAGEATIRRTLTVDANCIVDVSVTVYGNDEAAVSDDVAEKVAQLMVDRIAQA